MLLEGEMKETMMETFMQTMLKNQSCTSTAARKGTASITLFVDASYEKNTK